MIKKMSETMMRSSFWMMIFFMALSISCQKDKFQESKTFVGGKVVPAKTLNLGYTTYMEYCVSCHGDKGDGQGVASKGLTPPPRDLTKGIYKFGWVVSGEIPTDEDFHQIIRKGLKGTAMLPWDISDQRLDAVIQYIKTLAPATWEAKDKQVGKIVELAPDPYTANVDFAIQKGKEVYHINANCQSCHRAYTTKSDLNEMSLKINKQAMTEFDEALYQLKLQTSEYQAGTLPPDFTWHEVRSAETVQELAMRIAAGVGGTAMPSWKGVLEDNEIWAVSYYVKYLMDLKGRPERKALVQNLK